MARKPSNPGSTSPDARTRIAVLVGPEAFLRDEHTARLRSALEEAHGAVDVLHFDGSSAAVADVLDECRSFGLMQQHKLVLVDAADQFVKAESRPLVERYAQSPSEAATLVLRCEKWNKGKLDAMIEAVGGFFPCESPAPAAAVAWIGRRTSEKHVVKITREAAEMLVDRVGTDLGRLDSELAKLSLAAEAGAGQGAPVITPELVSEMVGMTREEEFWSIQRELLSRDPQRTLRQLHTILDNGSRDSHVPVTWACVDLARKLHAACMGAKQGDNPHALAKELKLWGPSRDAILGEARRADPAAARDILAQAVAADRKQKTGIGSPYRTLELLALRFAGL